jgi:hypothetical protein
MTARHEGIPMERFHAAQFSFDPDGRLRRDGGARDG